jgi:hypothetical protein
VNKSRLDHGGRREREEHEPSSSRNRPLTLRADETTVVSFANVQRSADNLSNALTLAVNDSGRVSDVVATSESLAHSVSDAGVTSLDIGLTRWHGASTPRPGSAHGGGTGIFIDQRAVSSSPLTSLTLSSANPLDPEWTCSHVQSPVTSFCIIFLYAAPTVASPLNPRSEDSAPRLISTIKSLTHYSSAVPHADEEMREA